MLKNHLFLRAGLSCPSDLEGFSNISRGIAISMLQEVVLISVAILAFEFHLLSALNAVCIGRRSEERWTS